jgi:hypothetical protein
VDFEGLEFHGLCHFFSPEFVPQIIRPFLDVWVIRASLLLVLVAGLHVVESVFDRQN